MRPQHITAETLKPAFKQLVDDGASMRPQHITAETARAPGTSTRGQARFNEAAAYNCGNRPCIRFEARPGCCFNEAAAYNCGNQYTDRL